MTTPINTNNAAAYWEALERDAARRFYSLSPAQMAFERTYRQLLDNIELSSRAPIFKNGLVGEFLGYVGHGLPVKTLTVLSYRADNSLRFSRILRPTCMCPGGVKIGPCPTMTITSKRQRAVNARSASHGLRSRATSATRTARRAATPATTRPSTADASRSTPSSSA